MITWVLLKRGLEKYKKKKKQPSSHLGKYLKKQFLKSIYHNIFVSAHL